MTRPLRPLAVAAAVALVVPLSGAARAATPEPGVTVVEPEAGPAVEAPVLDLVAEPLDLALVTGPADGAVTDAVAPEEQVFTAAADVFFAFDSATLSDRAREELARIAQQVDEAGLRTISVVGHTDAIGDDAYNLDLSKQRAEAVRAVLTEALPSATVTAEGVGEAQPVAPETVDGQDNPDGRAANRRVEIRAES